MNTQISSAPLEDSLAVATPRLIAVDDFTTFRADYGLSHKGHFIIHFYATQEVKDLPDAEARKYWLEVFPQILDVVTASFMKYLGLKCYFIEDMISWCVEGEDIEEVPEILPDFFIALDQALEAKKST